MLDMLQPTTRINGPTLTTPKHNKKSRQGWLIESMQAYKEPLAGLVKLVFGVDVILNHNFKDMSSIYLYINIFILPI